MATNFGKLDFATSFSPLQAFPLDARSYFESLALAQTAAASAGEAGSDTTTYYFGQIITVFENNTVSVYKITKGAGGVGQLTQIDAAIEPGDLPKAEGTTQFGAVKLAADSGLALATGLIQLSEATKASLAKADAAAGELESALAALVHTASGSAGTDKYVSQVTQTDGKVSVTYGTFNFDEKGTAQGLIDVLSSTSTGSGIVSEVTQTKGKVTVTKRALVEADIPALSISKTTGLQTALDAKQDALAISANYNGTTSKIASTLDIDNAIAGLGQAISWAGDADQDPKYGDVETVNGGTPVVIKAGNVVSYGNKEYICTAVNTTPGEELQTWREMGDESAYVVKNAAIAPVTTPTFLKMSYDAKGLVTGSAAVIASDIPDLAESQITGLTTDLAARVLKTQTIAGVDLQDNITKAELLTALNVADGAQVNVIESIYINGEYASIDNLTKEASIIISELTDDINDSRLFIDTDHYWKIVGGIVTSQNGVILTTGNLYVTEYGDDTTLGDYLGDIGSRLTTAENDLFSAQISIGTLNDTVSSHTTSLNTLTGAATVSGSVAHAEASAATAQAKADANETAIGNLSSTIGTLPAGQSTVVDYITSVANDQHEHTNKSVLDGITATLVTQWNTAYTNNHTHNNKALLDTYTQTETDLADAVAKKHEHTNKTVLDGITAAKVTAWDSAEQNAITTVIGTSADTQDVSTIYGAKAYADSLRNAIKTAAAAITFDKDDANNTVATLSNVVDQILKVLNPVTVGE